jgi:hypothetical protein
MEKKESNKSSTEVKGNDHCLWLPKPELYRSTEKYQFLSVFAKICFPILGILSSR